MTRALLASLVLALAADGWIRELLGRQRSGLTGHIEAAGYPFDTCAWACPEVPGSSQKWWPLVPYGSTLLRVAVFPRLPETEAGGHR